MQHPAPPEATVVRARYGGTYEPGLWLAFPGGEDQLPHGWNTDDVTAARYFEEHSHEIGAGDTPEEALASLRALQTTS